MFNNLKPYPSYTTSIDWLPATPSHWGAARFRNLLREWDERSADGSEQLLRVSQYTGVTERRSFDGSVDSRASTLVDYKRVGRDDLAINIMLAWNGSLGVSSFEGIVSPAYCVYRFSLGTHPWYYHHLLRSSEYKARIRSLSTGVVESRLRLYTHAFFGLQALQPPVDEQAAIVKYLGHAHKRIDRAIAAKRKLIALLEEQKHNVIHQAVTRGLNPSVPLKDSGSLWLGEVPDHWEVLPLKRLARFKSGAGFPVGFQGRRDLELAFAKVSDMNRAGNEEWMSTADSWISREDARELGAFVFPAGTVVFPKVGGALLTNKRRRLRIPSCVDNNVMGAIFGERVSTDFGFLLLSQINMALYVNPGPVPAIGESAVGRIGVAVPPSAEQAAIVGFVVSAARSVTTVVRQVAREIELLREFRTRLTSDVVTGQVDVREIAATLPELTGEALASVDETFNDDDELAELELDVAGANE